jgi:Fur family transcriptional regulator, peroxide stress response regulator
MDSLTVKKFLSDNGIKPSLSRIKIYEYLYSTKAHPTVDMIYSDLLGELLTLSKTTVYNTLKCFDEAGIVKVLSVDSGELRFDADTSSHGHFKCRSCGKVYDFAVPKDFNLNIENDFTAEEIHIYVKGLCSSCEK